MIAGRRIARWIAAGALALVPALMPAVAQADDQLQLSSDDQHWHSDLDHPLFDPARRWVPGDAETSSFWIRNTADTGGRLGMAAQLDDVGGLLQHGFQVRARTAGGSWVAVPTDGSMQALSGKLAAGSTTRIWVSAAFSPLAGDNTEDRRLDLDFDVTLTELTATTDGSPTAPATQRPGPPGTPSGPLGSTGLAGTGLDRDVVGLAIVAVVTITAGALAIRSGRRGGANHGGADHGGADHD